MPYPWNHGDAVSAADLNAAIANAGALYRPVQTSVAANTSNTMISPQGAISVLVTASMNTTINIAAGYVGQALRVEIKQDSIGNRQITFGNTIALGTDLLGFIASGGPGMRDLLQFVCANGTAWMLVAVSHGFGV